MLIKIQADDDLVERLKDETRERTGSKAVSHAAAMYLVQRETIESQQTQIAKLIRERQVLKQTIERARESAAALLDHVAQGDLLDE